mgnify:CR=1 FL=1
MKRRNGFVSNSSSTSFTCEICGETESGWDSCSREEYGFYQCRNEHEICESCLDNTETEEDDYWGTVLKDGTCPICNFEIISDWDMKIYLSKIYKIEEAEVLEDIKKVNKRRRKVYTKDYINYICLKFNLQILDLVTKIKEEYKNYKEFFSFISKKE